MPVIQKLRNQLSQVHTLKTITGTFSEISALRINSIRNSFEQNSLYFEEISQVYHLVKRVASQQGMQLADINTSAKSYNRTLHIGITSNHRFYDTLNSDTVDEMSRQSMDKNSDRLIIGKVGILYAQSTNKLSPFDALVFSKDEPTSDEIQSLLDQSDNYRRIYVYYPKFVTMFSQKIDRVDISHSPEPNIEQRGDIRYIFEPELNKILSFFEKQVRYILFVRVLLETTLSRTATRLIGMDAAERRAGNMIDKLRIDISHVRQSTINAQLIASSAQLKKRRSQSYHDKY